ncbi:MAG: hypothetical protein NC121_18315 [Blautia sp.]|nr:hypothetical protein [Blautia sp.]
MLYHVSPNAGLKTLHPHESSHKTAYVYATENFVTGLLFGVKQDDFDFCISTDEKGCPTVYECYPDAFRNRYQGKSCSVYVVDEEGFQRGFTSWDGELVCDKAVEVRNEIRIIDLYDRFIEEESLGNIVIHRYEFHDDYRKKISAHVVDRLIRFDIDLQNCLEQDIRFSAYYKGIVEGLLTVMDGHLLK